MLVEHARQPMLSDPCLEEGRRRRPVFDFARRLDRAENRGDMAKEMDNIVPPAVVGDGTVKPNPFSKRRFESASVRRG